jgi:hypothetical protein
LGSGRRTRKSKLADVNALPMITHNSSQVRDSLDGDLLKADEKISAAQSDFGQFDVIFQEAEKEYEVAAQALSRVVANCERIREDKKEIKARIDEEMNERHDLQAGLPDHCEGLCPVSNEFFRLNNVRYGNTSRQMN